MARTTINFYMNKRSLSSNYFFSKLESILYKAVIVYPELVEAELGLCRALLLIIMKRTNLNSIHILNIYKYKNKRTSLVRRNTFSMKLYLRNAQFYCK